MIFSLIAIMELTTSLHFALNQLCSRHVTHNRFLRDSLHEMLTNYLEKLMFIIINTMLCHCYYLKLHDYKTLFLAGMKLENIKLYYVYKYPTNI